MALIAGEFSDWRWSSDHQRRTALTGLLGGCDQPTVLGVGCLVLDVRRAACLGGPGPARKAACLYGEGINARRGAA